MRVERLKAESLAWRWLQLAVYAVGLSFALGCSKGGSSSSSSTSVGTVAQDFMNTQISTTATAPADGESPVAIYVTLLNGDGSPILDFRPNLSVAAGTGVTLGICSVSNQQGVAICYARASTPGIKTLQLTNAKKGLSIAVNFPAPVGEETASMSAGAIKNVKTQDGYSMRFSVGGSVQRYGATTYDGYTVKLSTSRVGSQ